MNHIMCDALNSASVVSVGKVYQIQKMYDQIIYVHNLCCMCKIIVLMHFVSVNFTKMLTIVICRVVCSVSDDGMAGTRQRPVKVLVELRQLIRCSSNLASKVQERGNFIQKQKFLYGFWL